MPDNDHIPILKRVSKLTFTILVDNHIEWMTKLPEGFTHEIPQHLPHSHIPLEGEAGEGVPVLNFENFCCGAHGFGVLIETEIAPSGVKAEKSNIASSSGIQVEEKVERHLTLFDTGPDSRTLVRNLRALKVPVTKIERVVTSHWHSDHMGGLISFLELRKQCIETESSVEEESEARPCIVDVHASRPILRGIAPPHMNGKVLCALPPDPTFEAIEAEEGVLQLHENVKEGHAVAGGTVWVSGEVPRVTRWEEGLPGSVRWVVEEESGEGWGKWVDEPHIMDERYAVVDVEGKGLVVFSSCSHAGIVNIVKDAVNTFNRPVYMIVGGLHLASADLYPRIEPTVHFISSTLRPSPSYILPMHCTGWKAKIALEAALGEAIVPAGVGHKVEIVGVKKDGEAPGGLWVQMGSEK